MATIERFDDAGDEHQLADLDAALETLGRSEDNAIRAAVPSLFRVFERFPSHDGFGVFWRILHVLESVPGFYEHELVLSLRRMPSEFGVTMVNRCLNAGQRSVGSDDLVRVLVEVSRDLRANARIREIAAEYAVQHRAG